MLRLGHFYLALTAPQLAFLPVSADTWVAKAPMPTGRVYLGVAAANNGRIYAIGGSGGENVVEEYDPLTNNWVAKAPMPTSRIYLGVAADSYGKIYAIGGLYGGYLNVVEEYEPLTDTWVTKATMPTGRAELGVAAASNGRIYTIGGLGGENVVGEYDPQTDIWAVKAPMPTGRYDLGVTAASNGKIYAIGGTDSLLFLNVVEEYDPQTDTWTTKAPMPAGRVCLGVAAASNGKIYAIGGFGGENVVEEYDPQTDTWTTKAPMPTGRVCLGVAAASNGKIYAIGGYGGENVVEEYTPPGWGRKSVMDSPQWLDETHFQISYDFTSLIPRGEYLLTVESALGNDGIFVAPFDRVEFVVDYAGEISDTTPPEQPLVLAWGNGSLSQLSAYAYAEEPDSQITGYRYAIGTTPRSANVVNWTNISQNQVTHTGLSLLPEQGYYVSFQARNEGGLWSPIGVSNPVVNGAGLKNLYLPLTSR